jgi:NAD(P)-dependent dehydrogenase (short-subunit alcohol dehydrogenase family)
MAELNPFCLDGRRILVTGAAGYLGTAIAESLTDAGAVLLLAGRSEQALTDLADQLDRRSGRPCASALILDISEVDSRRLAAARMLRECERLHGIVNNAYGGRVGTLEAIAADDFASACAQNLTGPFELIQLLLPLLSLSASEVDGGVSIVNVASMYGTVSPDPRIYGDKGTNNPIHYGSTKAGMIQMTRYLACHLANRNIRVNSVSPGPCPRPQVTVDDPEFVARLNDKTPLGRIGRAVEVARPVHFLLSAAASYITGVNLPVDGGWTAW